MRNPSSPTHPHHHPAGAAEQLAAIRSAVLRALDRNAAAWFTKAQQQIEADRSILVRLFPAVSRKCGRAHLWPVGPELIGWTVDDGVCALLLIGTTIEEITAVYRYGDPGERRAVLRALHLLDIGDAAVPLVLDALHSNDTKLIAAAVGPYAAEHLPADAWRQAVLTCVTHAVPLAWVAGLKRRADDELIRLLRDHAERCSDDGRPTSPDLVHLLRSLGTDTSAGDAGGTPPKGIINGP
jgi:hypothetical protein